MDRKTFESTVARMHTDLTAMARGLLHCTEDAEDVVQECFLKLWTLELSDAGDLRPLAFTVTRHLCLNMLRRRKLTELQMPEFYDNPDELPNPEAELINRQQVQQVLAIIDELPGLQQMILRMKHIEGMEVEEISKLTGSNAGAIRTNLCRARRAVWNRFNKENEQ